MKKQVNKTAKQIKNNLKPWHIIIAAMVLFILFNGSLFNVVHNKIEISKLKKQDKVLDEEYTKFEERLNMLESGDKKYLETIARTKYHLTKTGETEFRFKNPKDYK